MQEPEEILLTPEEAAGYLKVSLATIYRYMNPSETVIPLPSYKVSKGVLRIKKSELDKWITDNKKIEEGGER